jgi:hypothetical protein
VKPVNDLCWLCPEPAVAGLFGDSALARCDAHLAEANERHARRERESEEREQRRRVAECVARCECGEAA